MPSSWSRIGLVAIGLVVTMNGPAFYLQTRVLQQEMSWEGPVVRELFVALAVTAVAGVVFSVSEGRSVFAAVDRRGLVAVALFTIWIVATSLWSVDPALTRARSVIYIGLACFALILASMSFQERRAALVGALAVVLGASLVAVFTSDSIGLDRNDDWRGIFTNRNSLAPVAGLAVLVGVGLAEERRGRARWIAAGLIAAGAAALLGSGSRTAWLALAVAVGVAGVVVGTRVARDRLGRRAIGLGTAVATAGAGVVLAVVGAMWDESTFVQRRTIWRLVREQIGERPLHGHGWFTMWTRPEFTSRHELLGRGSAHDSFLDVWLGAGLLGAVGFTVIVAFALWRSSRAAWLDPSPASATWLAVIVFLVIENVTESFVLWFSYNWVLVMTAALIAVPPPPAAVDERTRPSSESVTA